MKTTLSQIRAHSPCADGWAKLLAHLGKSQADDEPLLIETILRNNGIDDALWCLRAVEGRDREIRLYAVWCARQVQHLLKDPRSIGAIDIAAKHARGRATAKELWAAWTEAADARAEARPPAAEWAAKWAAAAAAREVAREAATWAAEWAAQPRPAALRRSSQAAELLRVCQEIESGRDPYPEEGGR